MKARRTSTVLATVFLGAVAGAAAAHVTPIVVLLKDDEAVRTMLEGATRYAVREVRLSKDEVRRVRGRWGWTPEDDFYRFVLGRDAAGALVGAVTFVTEFTAHGPVRVAVALNPDGTVHDARIVRLTEETVTWVKPLIDEALAGEYAGRSADSDFGIPERFRRMRLSTMQRFYAEIVGSLVQRAAILYRVAVLDREAAGIRD
jgi:hypothetical protein